MRKSRFTESQIIGILKEVESGRTGQEVLPGARDQRAHAVPLEEEVRRDGGERRQAASGARGRESQAQAHRGGPGGGPRGAQGCDRPKMVTPKAKRERRSRTRT